MAKSSTLVNRSPQWYGWLPDLPDHRDFYYSSIAPKSLRFPSRVDLRGGCSRVENQGSLGCCSGHALAGAIEFLENKMGGTFTNVSRLFIYYNERAIEGTIAQDSGAFLRDGIKSLAKLGVCSEKEWPYHVRSFTKKPHPSCYKSARKRQITSYHRISTVDEMRICLAEGFPFVFGFTVYQSFESKEVERTGVLNLPKPKEQNKGGHAVLAVGYVDRDQRFIVRNSWGADWGQEGYFTVPYAYLADRNLSDDFWTIRAEELG